MILVACLGTALAAQWSCTTCTLLNPQSARICNACGYARTDGHAIDRRRPIREALFFESAPPRAAVARPDAADDREDKRRLVSYLRDARSTLDVCVFTINDDELRDVVLERHQSGVRVRIISDNRMLGTTGSDVRWLADRGVAVKVDRAAGHMHHKFAIVDNEILNGSYNWTAAAATGNYENATITNDPAMVTKFVDYFERFWTDRPNQLRTLSPGAPLREPVLPLRQRSRSPARRR